nr:hypothetical protein [Chloroflexota bacterium]
MPAIRSTDPSIRTRPTPAAAIAFVAAVAVALAACGNAATPRPTIPPDATGSLVP